MQAISSSLSSSTNCVWVSWEVVLDNVLVGDVDGGRSLRNLIFLSLRDPAMIMYLPCFFFYSLVEGLLSAFSSMSILNNI